jgi:hypothetical protein
MWGVATRRRTGTPGSTFTVSTIRLSVRSRPEENWGWCYIDNVTFEFAPTLVT